MLNSGETRHFVAEQVNFLSKRLWFSPHANANYPVEMFVRTGEYEWRLYPLFDDQELDMRGSTGAAYWER